MTAQTSSYLKNTLLGIGQAQGAITPTRMADEVDSFVLWDQPGGVATPYLGRGTYDGYAYFIANGGAVGSMTGTPAQRATNGTVLNTLFSTAVSNGRFVDLEPNTYEINNAGGLIIPATTTGFTFRGSKRGTTITQFASNAPILTLGDATGATNSAGWDFRGIALQYGVTQSGLTGAFALSFGQMQTSIINDIYVPYGPNNFPPYNAFQFSPGANTLFQNIFENWEGWAFQANGLYFNTPGGSSGNIWRNCRFTPLNGAITGSCINFNVACDDTLFDHCNIEGASGNAGVAISAPQMPSLRFIGLHLELMTLTGVSPYLVYFYDANIVFDGFTIVNLTTTGATGTAAVFHSGDFNGGTGSVVRINGMTLKQNTASILGTTINVLTVSALKDSMTNFVIEGAKTNIGSSAADIQTAYFLDSHMPAASFKFPIGWDTYAYGSGGSFTRNAAFTISATYTHYGQHEDADIFVPVSITSFTLTLATTQGATGTQKPRTGSTTRVHRMSGTPAGTLTVAYGGAGTPTTNTTAATDYFYVFDGTNWQTFTPVT